MLPVRKSGGPGKEVPPERASTNHKKKGTVRYWELPKKNTETCFDKMERICPASIEGHANAAVHSGRMKRRKFYHNRPIDSQKAQLTRPLSWAARVSSLRSPVIIGKCAATPQIGDLPSFLKAFCAPGAPPWITNKGTR